MFQRSEYGTDYKYACGPNMLGFIIQWKEVSVGETYINFLNGTFFNLVFLLKQKLKLHQNLRYFFLYFRHELMKKFGLTVLYTRCL